MTLAEVIREIERAAGLDKSVHMIVRRDVFRLNNAKGARYGVFAWEQTTHTQDIATGSVSWGFRFFYIDRLTSGNTNETCIQSAAQQVLEGVIYTLQEGFMQPGIVTYTPFTQRFADDCAGMYCELTLETDAASICPEDESYTEGVAGNEIIYI